MMSDYAIEKDFAEKAFQIISKYQPVSGPDIFLEGGFFDGIMIGFRTDIYTFPNIAKKRLEQLAISMGMKITISLPTHTHSCGSKPKGIRPKERAVLIGFWSYLDDPNDCYCFNN